jgi:hypothetical protein
MIGVGPNPCSLKEKYEDEGTFELLVSIMRIHEKMAWMLRSYIENEPAHGESQKRIFHNE